MDENCKINEADQIRALLCLLAGRGYVRICELTAILRGCRGCTYTLDDLKRILSECAEETVEIIDDSADRTIGSAPVQSEEEPHERVLREDLEFSPETAVAMPGKTRHSKGDAFSRDPHSEEELNVPMLQVQSVINELMLRKRFGILQIGQAEYQQYLRDLILFAMLDEAYARRLLDGYLRTLGITPEVRTDGYDRSIPLDYEIQRDALLPEEEAPRASQIKQKEDRQNGRR